MIAVIHALSGLAIGERVVERGKSGLRRAGWSVTPTGRKARESATENKPPNGCVRKRKFTYLRVVRVKRRGKSSPALKVTSRPGKPHPEQDRTEVRTLGACTNRARFGSNRFQLRVDRLRRSSNGRPRLMIVASLAKLQNPAYRLTSFLIHSLL
jgi:hypothetical protein